MKILVTGAAGYVGSTLTELLASNGHQVIAVDNHQNRLNRLQRLGSLPCHVEYRWCDLDELVQRPRLLADMDAIIHLAGISSDVAAERDPELTVQINTTLATELAQTAKAVGIPKFLLASTAAICQVPLGHEREHAIVYEDEPPPLAQPIGMYAQSKLAAEEALARLADAQFHVIVLRKGSLYGYSPIMRWDLILNRIVLRAWFGHPLVLYDFGRVWRPIAHVLDAARAYQHLLEYRSPVSEMLIFHLVERNARLSEACFEADRVLRDRIGRGLLLQYGTGDFPQRTGRVSGDALRRTGWTPLLTFKDGVADLAHRLEGRDLELPEEVAHHASLSPVGP